MDKYNACLQALNAVHYLLHCPVEFSEDIKIVLCRVAGVVSDSVLDCLTDIACDGDGNKKEN